jgi:hypothetical protein
MVKIGAALFPPHRALYQIAPMRFRLAWRSSIDRSGSEQLSIKGFTSKGKCTRERCARNALLAGG